MAPYMFAASWGIFLFLLFGLPLVAFPVSLVLIKWVRDLRKLVLGTIAYAESPGGPVRPGGPGGSAGPGGPGGLTPVELGALAGGVPRAVEVAFVSLLDSGLVQADPRTGTVRAAVVHARGGGPPGSPGPPGSTGPPGPPGPADPLQAEIWHLLSGAGPQGYRVPELLARAAQGSAADALLENLARKRLCVDPGPVREATRMLNRYRIGNLVMGGFAVWGLTTSMVPYLLFEELIQWPAQTWQFALVTLVPVSVCAWQIRSVARLRVPFLTELGRGLVEEASRRFWEASGPVDVGSGPGAGAGQGHALLSRVAVNGMRM